MTGMYLVGLGAKHDLVSEGSLSTVLTVDTNNNTNKQVFHAKKSEGAFENKKSPRR